MDDGHRSRVVTLLTDFGTQDGYVAAMKGVMLCICPAITMVDITHAVPAQDVGGAAFVLAAAWRYFAPGTVHLVVVDPGVGGRRRAIAVQADGHFFVAPDNGVLGLVLGKAKDVAAVSLVRTDYWRTPEPSATFHGRDVFGPVAAHLARGACLADLGEPVDDLVSLSWPKPVSDKRGRLSGQVIHVDHFGNLITNLTADHVAVSSGSGVMCGGQRLPILRTFADVAPGELLAYLGSHGLLEVAVRNGNASQYLGVVKQGSVILEEQSSRPEMSRA